MVQPLHIKNAKLWTGDEIEERDLFTIDRVVAARPDNALEIDLEGYTIFPGLINAHDHLELNHFPRTKFRDVYPNAHEWGEDVQARLDESPFKELRAYAIEDRCFIGGLKNLLCGATTVVHHNPPHKTLFKKDFPVRVLRRYGWAHSLHFSNEDEIKQSYANTPKDVPWFIHLAEGTDDVAANEYRRLKALGCVSENTVIVHGVGLTDDDIADAAPRVRGLVWCPSTNLYLLGKTANIIRWIEAGGKFAIGSDSRLTAAGDYLCEENTAWTELKSAYWSRLEQNPHEATTIIGRNDVGHLNPGAQADWFIYPEDDARRFEIKLIVKGGIPQIGDPNMMAKFPHIPTVRATLDGRPKYIHEKLARRIIRCGLNEPGLTIDEQPGKTIFFWRN
ncbi:MAG: hypothetical protein D6737_14190 [Chloroflexi bacterium]|nr:MAG: hypothetical protein D6737_14190 [Chloroflexota bacterium]